MFPAKGLLFDLDGTLVESFPDIAYAVNLMRNQMGMGDAREKDIRNWVGNGSPKLIERALTGDLDGEPESELLDRGLQMFLDYYAKNIWVNSEIYPGVVATLEQFLNDGFRMACVTNKPSRHTHALLSASGLSPYFTSVVAGDTLAQRKPDPAPLLCAAAELGLSTGQCIMVGDSVNDILAAQAATIPVLCLTYGYNQGLDLSSYHPNAMLDQFAEIGSLVEIS